MAAAVECATGRTRPGPLAAPVPADEARNPEPSQDPSIVPDSPVPAPSVLAGMRHALAPHAPFAAMRGDDLDRIVRASQLQYFAPGEVVLRPASERPAHCYVIRQGTVRGERPGESGGTRPRCGSSPPAKCFRWAPSSRGAASRASIARRATRSASGFPAAVFDAMLETSPVFQDFCTRRLAHLLDLSRTRLQAEYAAAATERRGTSTPLSALLHRSPITCGPDAPLGDALAVMEEHRIGSVPDRRRRRQADRHFHAAGRDRPRRASAAAAHGRDARRDERAAPSRFPPTPRPATPRSSWRNTASATSSS